MEHQTDNCSSCGKPRTTKGSLSITQWVFGSQAQCRCGTENIGASSGGLNVGAKGGNGARVGSASKGGSGAKGVSLTANICPRCKKPEYETVRTRGSITQWVMRSNACSCNSPRSSSKMILPSLNRTWLYNSH
jgi:hypothetical protein